MAKKYALFLSAVFSMSFFAAGCGQTELIPVIVDLSSHETSQSLSGSPSVPQDPDPAHSGAAESRGRSAAGAGSAASAKTGYPGGASAGERTGPASAEPAASGEENGSSAGPGPPDSSSSSSEPEQRAAIADKNLLKALNTAYFDRPGDEHTQPTLREMRSLKTDISVTTDCGVRSLKGIEAAENIQTLDIRRNPLRTLSDVDLSRLPKLTMIILIGTQIENLNGVCWTSENIRNLTIAGDDETGAHGALSDISGTDWRRFTSLATLNLSYNRIGDFAPLQVDLPALAALNFEYNGLPQADAAAIARWFRERHPAARVYDYQG